MTQTTPVGVATFTFLQGGGEMGARMRAMDWSTTALGPVDAWPQSLRSTVSMLLPSRAQIILFWGPEFSVALQRRLPPCFRRKASARPGTPRSGGVERNLGRHAARAAGGRRPHRRGVLGEGPPVRGRALRLSGRDLLRRLLRSGARRIGRRRRRVLHRDRNDRTRGGRATPGPVEGPGRAQCHGAHHTRRLHPRHRDARRQAPGRHVRARLSG